MANTLETSGVVELTDSFAAIYTVPTGKKFTASMVHICNHDSADHTVFVTLDSGAGTAASKALVWGLTIAANDFLEFGKGLIGSSGMALRAKADVASMLTMNVSGVLTG